MEVKWRWRGGRCVRKEYIYMCLVCSLGLIGMDQELKYPIVTHDDAVLVRTWKIYHITKKKKIHGEENFDSALFRLWSSVLAP